MKIANAGIISTSVVIAMGVFIIIPPYLPQQKPFVALLFFDISNEQNLPQWCNDLSSTLQKQNVKATIFVTGEIAQNYPSCVSTLAERNDVGSSTYDYSNLTGQDYSDQLDEVKGGKDAVDAAGNIDSKLFKAPYGQTDSNIYSILNQSGILVDFSYDEQYNKFYNGKFLKFDDAVYDGTQYTPDFFRNLSSNTPVIIDFDNNTPVSSIDDFISHLKTRHILLLNASELTGLDLTVRQEQKT
jgi:peptidoglycan/xylan/chitin deacetylase (PgdA/CDA1 family)